MKQSSGLDRNEGSGGIELALQLLMIVVRCGPVSHRQTAFGSRRFKTSSWVKKSPAVAKAST